MLLPLAFKDTEVLNLTINIRFYFVHLKGYLPDKLITLKLDVATAEDVFSKVNFDYEYILSTAKLELDQI